MEKVKECTRCKEILPYDRYYLTKQGKYKGRPATGMCRSCTSKYQIERRAVDKQYKDEQLMGKTKRCNRCEQMLSLAMFNKNRTRKDGLQSYCRPCHKEMEQIVRARKAVAKAEVVSPETIAEFSFIKKRAHEIALTQILNNHKEEFEELMLMAIYEMGRET